VFFNQLFEPHGGNLECDLNKKDITTICKNNTFIYEVLTSLMIIKHIENTGTDSRNNKQYYGITLTSS